MVDPLADAYSRTGAAWQAGPGLVYDRLADVVVARAPIPLDASLVLDLGAGTGAASRAIARAGGTAIAVDIAWGMLAADRSRRPPAAVGDAASLPFRRRVFDAVVAAFSLNHLEDPVPALREAVAVLRPGGALIASAYAHDDDHPVKRAAEAAAREFGWCPPEWYAGVRDLAVPKLSTVERAEAALRAAGVDGAAIGLRVPFPGLGPAELVAWRLGMAHVAPFIGALDPPARQRLTARAIALLDECPQLERSIILIVALADRAAR